MNVFKIIFLFPIDLEREFGASSLTLEIVSDSQSEAIKIASQTIPEKMVKSIKEILVL